MPALVPYPGAATVHQTTRSQSLNVQRGDVVHKQETSTFRKSLQSVRGAVQHQQGDVEERLREGGMGGQREPLLGGVLEPRPTREEARAGQEQGPGQEVPVRLRSGQESEKRKLGGKCSKGRLEMLAGPAQPSGPHRM